MDFTKYPYLVKKSYKGKYVQVLSCGFSKVFTRSKLEAKKIIRRQLRVYMEKFLVDIKKPAGISIPLQAFFKTLNYKLFIT